MVRAAGNSAYTCGTKITIPCRARVSNTREAFFRCCRRSGFFTSVRLTSSFGPRENCDSSSRSHASGGRRPT